MKELNTQPGIGILGTMATGFARLQNWIHSHHSRLQWLHSLWALLLGLGVMYFSRHDFRLIRLVTGYLFFIWIASLILHWEAERWGFTEERHPRIRRVVLYIIQNFYHEMLFFLLPLYYASTTFSSLNVFFFLLLLICCLIASMDAVYWQWLTDNTIGTRLFYCFLNFACFNIFFPVVVGIRNSYSLYLAAFTAVFAMVSLAFRPKEWWSAKAGTQLATALVGTLVTLYFFSALVPPCPLSFNGMVFSTDFQSHNLLPIHEIKHCGELGKSSHLYVLASIRAPLGIQEKVSLDWYCNQKLVRQGRLVSMTGGRKDGFRVWDRLTLGENLQGDFRVDIYTEGRQLIGRAVLPH